MAMITAPYVETQQVVSGFLYQLAIGEEENGPGITRLDIGPYYFGGAASAAPYPEALTNEMTPPGWAAVRWFTDGAGASWLRWDGGRIAPEDGEMLFQMTSNYPACAPSGSGVGLYVGRGTRTPERFAIAAPDYSQSPPVVNSRHDVKGQIAFAPTTGCAPVLLLAAAGITLAVRHWI